MDIENSREVQMPSQVIVDEVVPAVGVEGGDWRTDLHPDSRQRIVNKIMETLKRHLPFSGQEGLQELKKIAVRFEEKIYTAATSQPDYLRKISLKMLTMETKYRNPMANSLQSNAASNSKNLQDPDSSSQTGSATDEDWQEGIYQKIKSMHEMYYPELNELYQRMAAKLQQYDDVPQQPKNESLEKLRFLKLMLERLMMFLRTNKNDIQPNHKDKIGGVEKQIVNILNSNRPRETLSSSQQGKSTQPPMQQPQMSHTHTNEGQMNSQMQPMSVQGSTLPTEQNNSTSLQHNTLTAGSNLSDSHQSNVAMEQNALGGSQHMTIGSGTSTNGQSNANYLQTISSDLQPQEYQRLHYQQLRWEQQLHRRQLIQQQQLIQQLKQQLLQQQQTSQLQPAQLHAQQQHMQTQHSLLQQMLSLQQKQQQLHPQKTSQQQSGLLQHMQLQLQPLKSTQQQSGLLQHMQLLQQKQQEQQLEPQQTSQSGLLQHMMLLQQKQQQQLQLQQTSQQQSRQLTGQLPLMPKEQQQQQRQQQTSQKQSDPLQGKEQDLEKQLLIPKQQNSQKQSGQKMMLRLKTTYVILVILALLLLGLAALLCGEVLRTYQLYWE